MNDNGLAVVGVGGRVVTGALDVVAGALADDDDPGATAGRASSWQPQNATTTRTMSQPRIDAWWQRYRATVVQRTPACVWRATSAVIVALDERFGEPVDAYVNGSQTWLRDDGPAGITLEWRLHPVAGYRKPPELDAYEIFPAVALAVENGAELTATIETLWVGTEAL